MNWGGAHACRQQSCPSHKSMHMTRPRVCGVLYAAFLKNPLTVEEKQCVVEWL